MLLALRNPIPESNLPRAQTPTTPSRARGGNGDNHNEQREEREQSHERTSLVGDETGRKERARIVGLGREARSARRDLGEKLTS